MNSNERIIKKAVKSAFSEIGDTARPACPEEDLLVRYCEGSLGEDQAGEVEGHMAACDLCLDTVMEYKRLAEMDVAAMETEVPETVTRRSIDLVPENPPIIPSPWDVVLQIKGGLVRLLQSAADLTPTMLEPVPVAIRGDEERGPESGLLEAESLTFSREIGELTADVEIAGSPEGLFALNILLSETTTGNPKDGLRITLTDMEYELESARTRRGMVRFEDHEVGDYCLEILDRDADEPGRITLRIQH